MTNEEAIAVLKERISCAKYIKEDYADIVDVKALEIAIEALEQQICEDCISRQAVLDKAVDYGSNTYLIPVNSVKTLPSVTSKEKTGKWISFGIQGEIDGQIVRAFTCSKCGAISIFRVSNGNIVNGDLCPNCGAKMIEPQESENKEDRE